MNSSDQAGMTLVELMVAMSIASITGAMILQMVISFQSRILTEIGRNELQDRAQRLVRFLANDISGSAFLLGPVPRVADGSTLVLVHDSLPGDPAEALPYSILAIDVVDGDDRLTIAKAESFSPPLSLLHPGIAEEYELFLNRRPNRNPGSTREIHPAPEAINHLVTAGHHDIYSVLQADQTLRLAQPLQEEIPSGTEVLGVRVSVYSLDPYAGSNRLRRDDFTSRSILDDAVDGLQFEYLLEDGSLVNQPEDPRAVRGVKVSLLVRDLRQDRKYIDRTVYSLGNRTYGPYGDHYRRCLATRLIEVKNNGLQ